MMNTKTHELPKTYDASTCEEKWYAYWTQHKLFKSTPDDREAYTVVIPPPNVTGVLHMGHMLNNTIQDVLVRRARMQGKNACWVPGTDHASIATEAKVVRRLREQGIKKSDLSRDDFMKHAWSWTEEHGGIILEQLKKLGASCDWDRTRFTLDEKYYEGVVDTFIDLFNKGLIYRGVRMVNWDPVALTALSDEEVIHREENGKLYHIRYRIAGTADEWLTIATTRPETILGDTAICVHPEDDRYTHLHGCKAMVPICNREVPIILDDYVDPEFGTGCLKVTPAHDVNDHELGAKHNLETIDILHSDGRLNEHGGPYAGQDRFDVRKQIVHDLDAAGHLVKADDYTNKVGRSERTDAVIEPRLSLQWFLSMKDLAKPALEHVMDDTIQFHPPKFKNSYRHWMENVKDWCVSRQLWWGHRIPAFYFGEGEDDFVVAKTEEEALQLAQKKSHRSDLTAAELRQDEDVMDTWFSSWLWPIQVFDGLYNEKEVAYYYPTADLVTAPEIMFFWVARMIMAGYEYREQEPFKNVYYTGIVRDKQGRKMSKSLGNSPDPIELMEAYGADGVRVGMLLTSPAGNDLPFDEKLCEQGRNFANKIWNAFRLTQGWERDSKRAPSEAAQVATAWMRSRVSETLNELEDLFAEFRLSEALMTTYRLVWDDFCSWYLELIKPPYGDPIDEETHGQAISIFEDLLKILHPFMPFQTEELWHWVAERKGPKESICVASWPKPGLLDQALLEAFLPFKAIVSEIRNLRKDNQIPQREPLTLQVIPGEGYPVKLESAMAQLCNLTQVETVAEKVSNSFGFVVDKSAFYVPFGDAIDVEAERTKLKKELDHLTNFSASVLKKLSNERFVQNAPEQVVALERKKAADAAEKMQLIEAKLRDLG
ncbi:MAG: valine--tRNA ligase [Flavobacteriales bacterium]